MKERLAKVLDRLWRVPKPDGDSTLSRTINILSTPESNNGVVSNLISRVVPDQSEPKGISEEIINAESNSGLPVEMVISAQGLQPKGRFDGKEAIMEVDWEDEPTVKILNQAMAKVSGELNKEFLNGDKIGRVRWKLGAITIFVLGASLAYWEFKEREGEDILKVWEKLREAKEFFKESPK